jgi:hypothetical protein
MSHRNRIHQALLSLGLLGLAVPAWAQDPMPIPVRPPSFGEALDAPTGKGPRHLAIADLNQDGIPDVVTANAKDRTVTILLGAKDGKLGKPKKVSLPDGLTQPTGVAAGTDFDLDGHLDVAVVGDDVIAVYSGDGKGGFLKDEPSLVNAFLPSVPMRELVIVELDEQYTPDLASLGTFKGRDGIMTVLPLDNGETRLFNDTESLPKAIAGGELTGDGHDDLVTVNAHGTVTLMSGKGDGTYYTPFKTYETQSNAQAIALGDVDGDRKVDVVVAGTPFVAFLKGDGNGNLAEEAKISNTKVNAKGLVLADFNGNGALDAAVLSSNGRRIHVLTNNGAGTFKDDFKLELDEDATASAIAVADINKDGKPDLIVAQEESDRVSVFLNTTGVKPDPEADAEVQLTSRRVVTFPAPYMLYEVRVTNNGPAMLDTANVKATLPEGLSATSGKGDCTKGDEGLTCAFKDISPGDTQSRFFQVPMRQFTSNKYFDVTAELEDSTPKDPQSENNKSVRRCITYVNQLLLYCSNP